MSEILLRGFPLPISINAAYRNLNIQGRPGRAKTREYKAFEVEVHQWAVLHQPELRLARAVVETLSEKTTLHMSYSFYQKDLRLKNHAAKPNNNFERRKLAGSPRRNDTSNRLKVLEDALAGLLGIDDCWFWSGDYNKFEVGPECREFVDVWIRVREA